MNREEFNQLDVKGQVEYFNNELKQENNNFNAICKSIGISKNTILNRFKAKGFEPSRAGQRIMGFSQQCGKAEVNDILPMESRIATSTEQKCSVEIENLISENSPMKNKMKANDPCEINLILKRIELLEQKVERLESEGIHSKKGYQNGEFRSDKNFIKSYENTTTKTFKIDVEVCKELENIFDKYKMYKKQDIVSSLLKYQGNCSRCR